MDGLKWLLPWDSLVYGRGNQHPFNMEERGWQDNEVQSVIKTEKNTCIKRPASIMTEIIFDDNNDFAMILDRKSVV